MNAWWRSHSVRMRLTLWHAAGMVVVLLVFSVVIYALVSRSAGQALDERVRADFYLAIGVIDRMPDGSFTWNPPLETSQEEELPWVQVWNADGSRLLFQNFQAQTRPVAESRALAAEANDRIAVVRSTPIPMRILSRRDSIYGTPVVIQVGRSEAAMRDELQLLALILMIALPIGVAASGFGGYVLAKGALAPVEQMTEHARLITAERLGDRLPVANPADEMGRLATVFNETLGRLEASFEQMRRFTADVSHELRTPLTSIRSVGEVGLRAPRDEAGYRAIIESMLEEADRLASLVDRLLALSRAEARQAPVTRTSFDLRRLVNEVASDLSVLAEEKRQTIGVDGAIGVEILADRDVLRQALINLVDNAVKYTPEGGQIQLRVSQTGRDAIVDVIDNGPGIPPDARDRVFERFYRAGAGEGAPGAGLGLSIARGAVEANGGQLTLEPSPAGSTFRVTIPRHVQRRRRRAG